MRQERHHKVIRGHVKDRFNQTNLEKGLAEDLIRHTLRDLKTLPAKSGLVRPHAASKRMITVLARVFDILPNDLADVMTSAEARSGAIRIKPGDAVFYDYQGAMRAGEIYFFASAAIWGELAFISQWERSEGDATKEFWKFRIVDDVIPVHIDAILDSSIWHKGTQIATILVPPALCKR